MIGLVAPEGNQLAVPPSYHIVASGCSYVRVIGNVRSEVLQVGTVGDLPTWSDYFFRAILLAAEGTCVLSDFGSAHCAAASLIWHDQKVGGIIYHKIRDQ